MYLKPRKFLLGSALIAAFMAYGNSPAAALPPEVPFPPPYVPGPPTNFPGATNYSYYFQFTYPQQYFDTRGVKTGALTGDQQVTAMSMPASKPGPAVANPAYQYSLADVKYGIKGGIAPPTPGPLQGGLETTFSPVPVILEDPTGQPSPTPPPGPEAVNPIPPIYPWLEAPSSEHGQAPSGQHGQAR